MVIPVLRRVLKVAAGVCFVGDVYVVDACGLLLLVFALQ